MVASPGPARVARSLESSAVPNGRRPVATGRSPTSVGGSPQQLVGHASCPRRRLRRCASGPAAAACPESWSLTTTDWQHTTVPCPATAPWALAAGRGEDVGHVTGITLT
jgi:hypothetical protein